MRTVPGMIVASGRDEHALRNLLYTAQAADHGPFAIRYPRGGGRLMEWQNAMRELPIGKGECLTDGSGIAVLTIGPVAAAAAEAVAKARKEGIDAAHYDMIFAKPIDEDILAEVAAKNCPIITVEDGTIDGGIGSAVSDWFTSHGIPRTIVRLGMPDKFIPQGTPAQLHAICGYDTDGILAAIIKTAKR